MATLSGKYAIVTGGTRNIGRAITEALINAGAVVMVCARKEDELQKMISEVDPSGSKLKGVVADVAKKEDCEKLVNAAIDQFGTIDILVNNAGIYGPIGLIEENDTAFWKQAFDVNLFGTVQCTQLVLPHMRKQKSGKIINLAGAGVGGKRPLPRFTAYFASKAAVVALTEAVAAEVVEDNIQVNCISPGAVNSYFTDFLLEQGKDKAGDVMYQQALKTKEEGGDPPQLAGETAVFLASQESNHITGKMLSAKWDKKEDLIKQNPLKDNLYNLRRIDDVMFYEK